MHALKHILTHIGVVVAIFVIAGGVAFVADRFSPNDASMLSLTSSSDTLLPNTINYQDPTLTTNVSTSNPEIRKVAVQFSVQPAEEICIAGKRQTYVGFISIPLDGGYFRLRSSIGQDDMLEPGPNYLFPNATYKWEAIARDGFVVSGPSSGTFTLSGGCEGVRTTLIDLEPNVEGTAPSAPTEPTQPIASTTPPAIIVEPNPPIIPLSTTTSQVNRDTPSALPISVMPGTQTGELLKLKVFADNVGVLPDGEVVGEAEIRIVASNAKKVVFVAQDANITRTLGDGKVDDLLSRGDQDVWTMFWDTTKVPAQRYRLIAKLTLEDGTVVSSGPYAIEVTHKEAIVRTTSSLDHFATDTKSNDTPSATAEDRVATTVVSPAECSSPSECRIFCSSSVERSELCARYISSFTDDELLVGHDDIDRTPASTTESVTQYFAERQGYRAFADTDQDGISDIDERNLYLTDPLNIDTDSDGVWDGAELIARTNPRGGERQFIQDGTTTTAVLTDEAVAYEDPKNVPMSSPTLLSVTQITPIATTTDATGRVKISKLALSGRAPANSFVTLYIYSDPIVVTIKADASGAWTYTLEKDLPDGSHEVFTAITDSGGKILARSEPLPFVKQAAAVSVGEKAFLPSAQEAPSFFSTPALMALLAMIVGILGVALSIIGLTVRHRREEHAIV